MKKKAIYVSIIAVICVLAVALERVVTMPTEYVVSNVIRGDITENVSADGKIISNHEITYYTDVAAPIEGLTLKVGDYVKAGDEICSYNTEDLETALERANLIKRVNETAQNALLEQDAKLQQKLSEATTKYEQACVYEEFFQTCVDTFEDQLYEIELQQQECEKLEVDVARRQAFLTHEMQDPDMDKDDIEDLNDELLKKTIELNDKQKTVASYDTASIKECMSDCQQELDHWKEEKEKEETRKENDDLNTMTSSGRANAEAIKNNSNFEVSEAEKELTKGQNIVTVKNDGIVTEVMAVDGETLSDGAEIIKVADGNDFSIRVDISKYDIDKIQIGQSAEVTIGTHKYEAKVERIDNVAENDDANKPKVFVEAKIINPDQYVIIGLEGDIVINTKTVENVCMVPVEAVYELDDGSYVYEVINGRLEKVKVETGCSDGENIEITDGITDAQQVVISAVSMDNVGKSASATDKK